MPSYQRITRLGSSPVVVLVLCLTFWASSDVYCNGRGLPQPVVSRLAPLDLPPCKPDDTFQALADEIERSGFSVSMFSEYVIQGEWDQEAGLLANSILGRLVSQVVGEAWTLQLQLDTDSASTNQIVELSRAERTVTLHGKSSETLTSAVIEWFRALGVDTLDYRNEDEGLVAMAPSVRGLNPRSRRIPHRSVTGLSPANSEWARLHHLHEPLFHNNGHIHIVLDDIFSARHYFAAHNDWYGLHDGRRRPWYYPNYTENPHNRPHTSLCYSTLLKDEDAINMAVTSILDKMREREAKDSTVVRAVTISAKSMDEVEHHHTTHCQCDACSASYEQHAHAKLNPYMYDETIITTRRFTEFVHVIRERVLQEVGDREGIDPLFVGVRAEYPLLPPSRRDDHDHEHPPTADAEDTASDDESGTSSTFTANGDGRLQREYVKDPVVDVLLLPEELHRPIPPNHFLWRPFYDWANHWRQFVEGSGGRFFMSLNTLGPPIDDDTDRNLLLPPWPDWFAIGPTILRVSDLGLDGVQCHGAATQLHGSDMGALRVYLSARMMYEPCLNATALIQSFLDAYYTPEAGRHIFDYLSLFGQAAEHNVLFHSNTNKLTRDMSFLKMETFLNGDIALTNAMTTVVDDKVHSTRVAVAKLPLLHHLLINWNFVCAFVRNTALKGFEMPFANTADVYNEFFNIVHQNGNLEGLHSHVQWMEGMKKQFRICAAPVHAGGCQRRLLRVADGARYDPEKNKPILEQMAREGKRPGG